MDADEKVLITVASVLLGGGGVGSLIFFPALFLFLIGIAVLVIYYRLATQKKKVEDIYKPFQKYLVNEYEEDLISSYKDTKRRGGEVKLNKMRAEFRQDGLLNPYDKEDNLFDDDLKELYKETFEVVYNTVWNREEMAQGTIQMYSAEPARHKLFEIIEPYLDKIEYKIHHPFSRYGKVKKINES